MKLAKTALVIALASVGTMAAAESQVTLYGTIDGAVVVNKAKGGDATVSLDVYCCWKTRERGVLL